MHTHTPIPFVRDLCSHLPEDEIKAAEERFLEYIDLALTVCERRERDSTHSAE